MKSTLLATLLFSTCIAQAETRVEHKWRDFQRDPKAAMSQVPTKYDGEGKRLPRYFDSLFNRRQVSNKEYVTAKARIRKKHLPTRKPMPFFSGSKKRVDELLDSNEFVAKRKTSVLSLAEMESRALMEASLAETPWSGSYWPIYQGGLGARYGSVSFLRSGDRWRSYYDFVAKIDPLGEIFASRDPDLLSDLSPAEKYDLLIAPPPPRGELAGVTSAVWNEGKSYENSNGNVERWMGICHGWAPASFSVSRPSRTLLAKAHDGSTALKFYPSDLKGLQSLTWAQQQVPSSFVGSRCQSKNPKKDPATDRILDEPCFDTNPAVWHVSIVNQIGIAKRSFVMDATYDYEVWNQPVYSYSYEYFNPQTGKSVRSWKDAVAKREDFDNDKFRKFRSPNAAKYVGISMTVTYVVESAANHLETDSPDFDQKRTVTYMYDLELDGRDRLIGGEWYNSHHPDFLWLPLYEEKPSLEEDDTVSTHGGWTPDQPLPEFWKRIARVRAESTGEPLPAIVDRLTEAATQ
ncbi:MAG: hypothetical protein AAB250_09295 [Bdellovibrionota bacterium]